MKINFKKLVKNPDVVGWAIWFVLTAALSPLCIHLMFRYTYGNTPAVARYIVGVFAAAMIAGLLSTGLNELWYRLRRKQTASKRKEGKKSGKGRAR